MKNAILPPVSSQLYIYGNNEAISDHVPLQMDSKLNVYVNNFCMDSEVLYNNNEGQFGVGGIAFPFQSPIDYQSGPSSSMTIKRLDCPFLVGGYPTITTSTYESFSDQQPLSFSKKLSVPQLETNTPAIQSSRKRPIDVNRDFEPEMRFNNGVGNKQPVLMEWATNKKKTACSEKQWQVEEEEQREIQRPRSVPMRRSQKVSDRITSLQKLVSPYGKTDTASVLQEASISIKILQDQIQNLIQTYIGTKSPYSQETGETQLDLRSRGLCLVPVSFTQKLTKE